MRTMLVVSAVLLSGCGLAPAGSVDGHSRASALTACEVALGGPFDAALATNDGLAVSRADGTGRTTVERLIGSGCQLESTGERFAATKLLDVDALGRLYVFPALGEGTQDTTTVTADGQPGDGSVVRIDRSGALAIVARAGRGIQTFGVSPSGATLWISSYGPTGIFTTQSMEKQPEPLMASPSSSVYGWVLTDDQTLWSRVSTRCAPATPLSRSTPSGTKTLGSAILDFGGVKELAQLSRCGSALCGFTTRGVVLWDSEGDELVRVDPEALGLREGERVATVTGNELGLYVSAEGSSGRRLVFVPVRGHSR